MLKLPEFFNKESRLIGIYKNIPKLYSLIPYNIFNNRAFPPLHVFFELTYKCNLRCRMCQFLPMISEYGHYESRKAELSTDEIKSILRQIPSYAFISFSGGEPFIRKDILEIIEFAAKRNPVHVVTNGTFFTEENVKRLISIGCRNMASKGLFMIGVSMEGPPEVHDAIVGQKGAYFATRKGLEMLYSARTRYKSKYPLLNLAVVMSEYNFSFLADMIPLAEELNVDILSFLAENQFSISDREGVSISDLQNASAKSTNMDLNVLREQLIVIQDRMKKTKVRIRFSPPGVPIELFPDLYNGKSLQKFKCYFPWSKVVVSAHGHVFPCLPFQLGNALDRPLKDIWNNPRAREFRSHIRKGLFPSCSGCCMLEFHG